MNEMHSLMRWLLIAACSISVFGAGLISYWLLWPYQVIEPPSEFIRVLNPNKTVIAGEPLIYESDTRHLTTGVLVTTSRQLVDGFIISLHQGSYVTDGTHFSGRNLSLTIPLFTPPGDDYYVVFQSTFHVNPLRDIVIVRRTETFSVAAPSNGD